MWRAVVEPSWDLEAWRLEARHALRAQIAQAMYKIARP